MPIYERQCKRCKTVYEHLCSPILRDAPDTCPGCDCPDTVRIMSATATNFKFADKSAIKKVR